MQVVGGTGMLVFMSPSLALLSVAVIPPVAVVGMLYGKYVKRRQKAVQAALGTSMEVRGKTFTAVALMFPFQPVVVGLSWTVQAAEELVSNIRTVKLFAQEGREKERFGLKMDAAYEQARQVGVASGWFEGAVHLAANMSLLTVLGYGGTLVVDGALTAGELTSFIVYSIYVGVNFSSVRNPTRLFCCVFYTLICVCPGVF
jgi:ABC-type multidrug transport system fused ATPase/permease subunit